MYDHLDRTTSEAAAPTREAAPAKNRVLALQGRLGNRAVSRLIGAAGPLVQRRGRRGKGVLATKDKGGAKRIGGSFAQLDARVSRVIEENNVKNMKRTAGDLRRSIAARKQEAERHDPNTESSRSHAYRIQQEEGLLVRLQAAIDAAAADPGGWQTV